jgi:SAM-dependent methyltransferase
MWGSGDYPHVVEKFLLPVGERLVDACGISPGQRVLDVAAETGNASIPAAARRASVTASDLTPALLEAGCRRSGVRGLDAVRDGREGEFDAALAAFGEQWNRGTPERARFEQEYLVAVGTKP